MGGNIEYIRHYTQVNILSTDAYNVNKTYEYLTQVSPNNLTIITPSKHYKIFIISYIANLTFEYLMQCELELWLDFRFEIKGYY